MKKTELIFSAILLPIDYLMIVAAALAAYFLRYEDWVQSIRPVIFDLNFQEYISYVWWIALVWLLFFALTGLYKIKSSRRLADESIKVFLACSTGMLAVIVGAFFSRELFDSRFILLAVWIFSIIFVLFFRLIIRGIQKIILRKGFGAHAVVLIGQNQNADEIAKFIKDKKEVGYKLIKKISNFDKSELENILSKYKIDEILLANSDLTNHQKQELATFCEKNHLILKYRADILASPNLEFSTLAGVPIAEIKKTKLDGWGKILKRLGDIILSFILLLILLPFFIIFALIIKLDSKGPIFYGSQRIGAQGQNIKIWKLRSMVVGADKKLNKLLDKNERADGPLFKMTNDPRVTRFGKFIRRLSIDELPQLWNVLIGNMSLVGPRPHEPHEVEKYKDYQYKLLNIKPGMTGMAQVSGRSDLSFEDEVSLDIFYIENWSPKLDFIIFLKTPLAVFLRKGAK